MQLPAVSGNLITEFLEYVLWTGEGFMHLARKSSINSRFDNKWVKWPEGRDDAIDYLLANAYGYNVYFSPSLYKQPGQSGKVFTNDRQCCLWCDLDEAPPEQFDEHVKPAVLLETSEKRWQAFWPLDELTPIETVEEINKRIAYSLVGRTSKEAGWAAGKLMRLPFTLNHKYATDTPWQVRLVRGTPLRTPTSLFSYLPEAKGASRIPGSFDPPPVEELPFGGDANELLKGRNLNLETSSLYYTKPQGNDWSAAFFRMVCDLFEYGFTLNEVYVLALSAECNKFVRDGRPPHDTWVDVLRAQSHVQQGMGTSHVNIVAMPSNNGHAEGTPAAVEVVGPPMFVDSKERDALRMEHVSFVQRYADWAQKHTDAPRTYHEAWGFMLLSCVLSGTLRVSTSFGMMPPNLWLLILADTTITRKSTAKNLAEKVLSDVNDEILLATDGSMEGMLTALTLRPRQPALFLRDEITGLIESMSRKDYMSGMMEALCALYDGHRIKRILRKEVFDITDPIFMFYGGGIKSRLQSILTEEHVTSGFLPRFLVITAETRHSEIKPLGRWTEVAIDEREALVAYLSQLYSRYTTPSVMQVAGTTTVLPPPNITADLTDEAWAMYNEIESAYIEMGLSSHNPTTVLPTMDRYSKHLLKLSALIAAEHRLPDKENTIVVTVQDLRHALSYLQEWAKHILLFLPGLGRTTFEQSLQRIYRSIQRHGIEGITRAELLRQHNLSAMEADQVMKTLDQRELVVMRNRKLVATIAIGNDE